MPLSNRPTVHSKQRERYVHDGSVRAATVRPSLTPSGLPLPPWRVLLLIPRNEERVIEQTGLTIRELRAAKSLRLRRDGRHWYLWAADWNEWISTRPTA
jgi:hypothetical protein